MEFSSDRAAANVKIVEGWFGVLLSRFPAAGRVKQSGIFHVQTIEFWVFSLSRC